MNRYESILGIKNTRRPIGLEFEYAGNYLNPDKDVYSTIMRLVNSGRAMIFSNNDVCYLKDIRPDYVNKRITVGIVRKDYHNEDTELLDYGMYYNFRVEEMEIYSEEKGFIEDLYVIPHGITTLEVNRYYRLNLNGMKMSRELRDTDKKAKNLFDRYIPYSIGNMDDLGVAFKYERIKKSDLFKTEREYLKKFELEFYGKSHKLTEYRDVRMFKYEEIKERYSDEFLMLRVDYDIVRLKFELELFTRLIDREYWEDWTKGSMENLLNGKFEYVKYKEGDFALIFKKRWIKG